MGQFEYTKSPFAIMSAMQKKVNSKQSGFVLETVEPVIRKLKDVYINEGAIEGFKETVKASELEDSELSDETTPKGGTDEQNIGFIIVYNTLNFCFWGEPKWTIEINGQSYDGSAGLLRAVIRAVDEGYNLVDPEYLSRIREKDLAQILRGNILIPLFFERLSLLQRLGALVLEKFEGKFSKILDIAENDAVEIVLTLANDLPEIFNDVANEVRFYKRAQLVPGMISDLTKIGIVSRRIENLDKLTAFADYKVPQLLRKYGILEYSSKLADKIDNKIEIPAGSKEEVEIRAATIWAVELVTKALKPIFPQATAAKIDGVFWFRGQIKSPNDKPYHRTRTIWY